MCRGRRRRDRGGAVGWVLEQGVASSTTPGPVGATASVTAPTTMTASPSANLIGSGCASYAAQVPTGPGSVAGMAETR
jgi:hypothetical protein